MRTTELLAPAYQVNTRANIKVGSGELVDAFGFIRTHGTVDLQTGVSR